jgi:hypothetical protein
MCASDDWNAEAELRSHLRSRTSGAKLGVAHELLDSRDVYVLIFNEGKADEGVYTLQDGGTPQSYVLAFEEQDEAARFAMLLQAEDFDLPSPVNWPSSQVTNFCSAAGFMLGLVPEGTLLVPPQTNSFESLEPEVPADRPDGLDSEDSFETTRARERSERVERLERLFGMPSSDGPPAL